MQKRTICTCLCGCKKSVEQHSPYSSVCCSCLIKSGHRFDGMEDPPCEECQGDLQDPALERRKWSGGSIDRAVKFHIVFKQYLCDWCLSVKSNNEISFIKTRIGDALDDEGLNVAETTKPKWYSTVEPGNVYGDEWKEYLIQYIGLVRHRFRKPIPVDEAKQKLKNKLAPLFLIILYNNRAIEVRRIRIFYKFSMAYVDIRYVWGHTNPPHVALINVEHVKNLRAFNAQAKKLWTGLRLRGLIESSRLHEAERFQEALDNSIRTMLKGGNDPRQNVIAQMLKLGVGDSGERQLQRRCSGYGIDYKERVRYWRNQK